MAVKTWFCDGEMANTKGQIIRVHPTEDGFKVFYTESENAEKTKEIVISNNTVLVKESR